MGRRCIGVAAVGARTVVRPTLLARTHPLGLRVRVRVRVGVRVRVWG